MYGEGDPVEVYSVYCTAMRRECNNFNVKLDKEFNHCNVMNNDVLMGDSV